MSDPCVREIKTEEDYASLVKGDQSGKLIVVDFYADWCGPCRQIGPKLEELAMRYSGKFFAFKVNVDELDEVGEEEGVTAMPTFIFYKGGEKVDTMVGASESKLSGKIENHL
ncbi:uncharacterized protein LOC134185594 [Corticium candelabrum]|uniref:uncharacterized protein LOC134185594 n=1 Tax=Corticium candelabrum TaxID=121492 RepID=UPI002E25BCA1|nr:uncharacterized protein LOC134185594 [Corticium candelabrum]